MYDNKWYDGFKNEEEPVLRQVFRNLKLWMSPICVDVGCDIGSTAIFMKEFGCRKVIGYDVDLSIKDNILPNSIDELHIGELPRGKLEEYIRNGYFLKFDCEGCEYHYFDKLMNYNNVMVCLHNTVDDYSVRSYTLMMNGFVPIFHSKDWKEICYIHHSLIQLK